MFFFVVVVNTITAYAFAYLAHNLIVPPLVNFYAGSVSFEKFISQAYKGLINKVQTNVGTIIGKWKPQRYEPELINATLYCFSYDKPRNFWDTIEEEQTSTIDVTLNINEGPFMYNFDPCLYMNNSITIFEWLSDSDEAFENGRFLRLELLNEHRELVKYMIDRSTPLVLPLAYMVSPEVEKSRLHSALLTIYEPIEDIDGNREEHFVYSMDATDLAKPWFFKSSVALKPSLPNVLRDVLLLDPFLVEQLEEMERAHVVFHVQIDTGGDELQKQTFEFTKNPQIEEN